MFPEPPPSYDMAMAALGVQQESIGEACAGGTTSSPLQNHSTPNPNQAIPITENAGGEDLSTTNTTTNNGNYIIVSESNTASHTVH